MEGTQENKMIKTATDEAIVSKNGQPPTPLIIDLGTKSRKNIKRLRKGRGRLMAQVEDCLEDLKDTGEVARNAQPILVVVKQKRKKKYRGLLPF